MENATNNQHFKKEIVSAFALSVALYALAMFIGFAETIVFVLYFLIFFEISRMLIEFIFTKRIRLRFMFDAGIIFVLRELFILLADKHNLYANVYILTILITIIGFFILFRIVIAKYFNEP